MKFLVAAIWITEQLEFYMVGINDSKVAEHNLVLDIRCYFPSSQISLQTTPVSVLLLPT